MKVQHADAHRDEVVHGVRSKWMVVDDTETVLQMTAEMLALFTDAEICCFQSGEAAVCAFQASPGSYALILTDFDMPKMDGVELCQKLRVIAPQSKIILSTGSTNISETKALSIGFDAFLPKPFLSSALFSVLERVTHAPVQLGSA